MRLVGEIEELAHARTFSDYLTQLGIKNQVIEEPRGDKIAFEIWVHEEDRVEQSGELLKKFLENPGDEEYQGVSKIARKIKKQAEKEAKEQPPLLDARTTIFYRGLSPTGTFTLLLIVACVVVSMLSRLGENTNAMGLIEARAHNVFYMVNEAPTINVKNNFGTTKKVATAGDVTRGIYTKPTGTFFAKSRVNLDEYYQYQYLE